MRTPFWIILGAAITLPGIASAQKIKVEGAALAGVCAGALDMSGSFGAQSGQASEKALRNMTQARDYYAAYPNYDPNEIAENAKAFWREMGKRIKAANDDTQRGAVVGEINSLAQKCFDQAKAQVAAARQGAAQSAQGGTVQPYTTQPLTTQPYTTQPLDAQPYTTQPLDAQPSTTLPLETQTYTLNPTPQ